MAGRILEITVGMAVALAGAAGAQSPDAPLGDPELEPMILAATKASREHVEPVEAETLASWMSESLRGTDPARREAIAACEARGEGPRLTGRPSWARALARTFNCARLRQLDVSWEDLASTAIRDALRRLDPDFAYFANHQEVLAFIGPPGQATASAGLVLHMSEAGEIKVVAVHRRGPAAVAGVRAGARLVAIDGRPVAGLTLEEAIARLRGAPDSEVTLQLGPTEHSGATEWRLIRRDLVLDEPWLGRRGDILIVDVAAMGHRTEGLLREQLRAAVDGPEPRPAAVILDLRGNSGGLLAAAVGLADLFLERGIIARTQDRHTGNRTRRAHRGDVLGGLPLYVLVDGTTASGAELLAAALADNDRARILGARTLGAGDLRTLMPLDERTGSWIHITTGRLLRGDNRPIADGLEPDLAIAEPTAGGGDDPMLDQAIAAIHAELARAPAAGPIGGPS